jgi:hypothetical protein
LALVEADDSYVHPGARLRKYGNGYGDGEGMFAVP